MGIERQRHEVHSGRIEILIFSALGMHTVETTDNIVVDHVHHRFCHGIVDAFKTVHALLYQHIGNFQPLLDHRHLVSLFAIQPGDLSCILHRHDAHTVGSRIGFDDDERVTLHAILDIFNARLLQDVVRLGSQTLLPDTRMKIDLIADGEIRIDQPWIDIEQPGKFAGYVVICCEML